MNEFIKVQKGAETIETNPSCLEDHKRLGWKVVEPAEAEAPTQSEPEKKPEGKVSRRRKTS